MVMRYFCLILIMLGKLTNLQCKQANCIFNKLAKFKKKLFRQITLNSVQIIYLRNGLLISSIKNKKSFIKIGGNLDIDDRDGN
ncbi:hypothetical protein BpHYR1_022467 [Brachionus plicatilis]|uniref:Uncharacterized protein n=1 Tax=Brachionus plicatilis TaxID=10195 RepID=A0A3M7R0I6_BRAPC|nr:hypothetical protein BpHYR1_022467 [Brachionus plicatilis]